MSTRSQKHQHQSEFAQDVSSEFGGGTCLELRLLQKMHDSGKETDTLQDYEELFHGLTSAPSTDCVHIVTSVVQTSHTRSNTNKYRHCLTCNQDKMSWYQERHGIQTESCTNISNHICLRFAHQMGSIPGETDIICGKRMRKKPTSNQTGTLTRTQRKETTCTCSAEHIVDEGQKYNKHLMNILRHTSDVLNV